MRIVVTGATGNVGTAVLARLHQEDVDLVGVVRRPPEPIGPYAGVEWRPADVAEGPGRLVEAFRGADAVVHLAWLLQPNHREAVLAATNVGGTRHVLEAVAEAGVPQVVAASSVGAYSPGPKTRRVDESWPTGGIATSHYARHKAVVERMLDAFEQEFPATRVARMRPGLVMQAAAGEELRVLFGGRALPTRWIGRVPVPVLPLPPRVRSQVVHADDLADAFARAVLQRASGAFNVAAEPEVGPADVARLLGGRWLPVRIAPVRGLAWLAWQLHLVAADPGWLDIATSVPLMSTERARSELGWTPRHDAIDALAEAIRGVSDRARQAGSPHLDDARGA
ncbi:NAD-dependent epimerase/dehydratase family protein [Amnibacterium endophyticum]|uniref:NAD-dependent epimerase/dehydratase family protein n=1 Tax=Amnibacterium endophyticum TaxID=2109337 RepID=A0ABW4LD30_9MICO